MRQRSGLENGGTPVRIRQETAYPVEGMVRLTLEPEQPSEFTLALRLPGWSPTVTIRVNGALVDPARVEQKGYARLTRQWKAGDRVELEFDMPVQQLYANPKLVSIRAASRFSVVRWSIASKASTTVMISMPWCCGRTVISGAKL